METKKEFKRRRTCEARVKNRCRTFNNLKLVKNEKYTLLVCEYHTQWHLDNGYEVIEFKKKEFNDTTEQGYTVDGRTFVKLSDFDKPKQKKFISNIVTQELNLDEMSKLPFKTIKNGGK